MIIDLSDLPEQPDVRWSVAVRDARTGELCAAYEPERQLRTASVGKIFLLIEVARQIEAGTLDRAEPLGWEPAEWVADSGLLYLLTPGPRPVSDLAVLVGAVSDNLATNVLLRRVGLAAVTELTARLGYTHSALCDRVRGDRGPDDPPTLSVGTGAELSAVMATLSASLTGAPAGSPVISPAVADQVLRWLAAGADLSMVAAAFDLDPLAHAEPDRGFTVINKTGTIETARIDIGIVDGPAGTLTYAVAANWAEPADPRDAVLATMRSIGARLRAAVSL